MPPVRELYPCRGTIKVISTLGFCEYEKLLPDNLTARVDYVRLEAVQGK